jgi:hypothetical protein
MGRQVRRNEILILLPNLRLDRNYSRSMVKGINQSVGVTQMNGDVTYIVVLDDDHVDATEGVAVSM